MDLDDIEDIGRGGGEEEEAPRSAHNGGVKRWVPPARAEPAEASPHVPGTQSVWVKTFGCAHNVSDGEYMAGQLQAFGYRLLDDPQRDQADCWVVNTCTVKTPSQAAMNTLIVQVSRMP